MDNFKKISAFGCEVCDTVNRIPCADCLLLGERETLPRGPCVVCEVRPLNNILTGMCDTCQCEDGIERPEDFYEECGEQ